jgi:site-specific DNA-adenine methylase
MNKSNIKLVPPCSYQGGKQRLAKKIVDIIFEQNEINEDTKFYDLCCGSGAITLELINRGIHPSNITMVDSGVYGTFWNSVANDEFDMNIFKQEIDKLPSVDKIQSYLQRLSNLSVNKDLLEYHYLLLQSGSFGSKQIWVENDKWKNNSFRSYWTPTETSNRRSPVNPMMPMPNTLFDRVKNIVDYMAGSINAINLDISKIEWHFDKNSIVYIDPPYKNTTGYGFNFDYEEFIINNWAYVNIYVSEGYKMDNVEDAILLSKGRAKGSISGDIKKKPTEEWLNIFKLHDLK